MGSGIAMSTANYILLLALFVIATIVVTTVVSLWVWP
jgi:hypothetical protein